MSQLSDLKKELRNVATEKKAKASSWFFKTGEGQYGYGDKFLGVTVPEQRQIAKKFPDLTLVDIEKLLESAIHEERLTALFILVGKYQKGSEELKKLIFEFYLTHMSRINNWDLVDSSAHKIVGDYIKDKKITLLLSLAKSDVLWERRIAIVSTFAFLSEKNSKPTFAIADILLSDREDLIQKSVGWLLREAGKQVSMKELSDYLTKNYRKMGRTALRYAIERFDGEERKKFLRGEV